LNIQAAGQTEKVINRTLTLCSFIVALSCASTGHVTAQNDVRQVEADWNQSRIAGDAHRVAELLDDQWTMIHVDGRIEGKKSYVEGIASGGRHILSINVVAQSIRLESAVAVVTGEVEQRGFRRGEMREGRLRYTHVWVRRGSSWRMLTSHSTEIKPQ
jgi:uncharacterized protein (TIGR02246 family)